MGSRVQITRTTSWYHWEIIPKYPVYYCIMVIPMVIPCYQMIIILLQFTQTICIQIWNRLAQRFCGSQWIKWIQILKMNSKIKLIKVERILVQVVPRFYEMMIGEPPNHRTVQRDDLRFPQLRGDWSPRRSSTIIPSPVHIKLIKHPISMVPMWKFPISTMVSFRVCFFFERGKGLKKKNIPFHSGWGTLFQEDLDAKNPPRYLGPFFGGWY